MEEEEEEKELRMEREGGARGGRSNEKRMAEEIRKEVTE